MNLEKSPLVEALFEVAFKDESKEYDPTLPGLFYSKIESDFPEKSEVSNFEYWVETKDGARRKITAPLSRFSNSDGSIIQLTKDFIVFNKIAPNINWLSLKDSILEKLEQFIQVNKNQNIISYSLKYFNIIEIPTDEAMEDNFTFSLSFPKNINYKLNGFLSKVHFETDGMMVRMNIESLESESEDSNAIALELIVTGNEEFAYNKEVLSEWLKEAHDLICRVFIESLNVKLKEKYGDKN
ncbi:TIGR04255 family protein [Pedobacter sp. G11]|uniref:TIGR04255 family protein n=1 Tax=Pedobacter sp. G11 TaxID=2482728 RepID=UPI000F5DE26A|nr:TIGR04255 family protein [Pedobacter sp. G11]AZI27037.1 TIGR04255 family protein [Pedobacter sp. G11]